MASMGWPPTLRLAQKHGPLSSSDGGPVFSAKQSLCRARCGQRCARAHMQSRAGEEPTRPGPPLLRHEQGECQARRPRNSCRPRNPLPLGCPDTSRFPGDRGGAERRDGPLRDPFRCGTRRPSRLASETGFRRHPCDLSRKPGSRVRMAGPGRDDACKRIASCVLRATRTLFHDIRSRRSGPIRPHGNSPSGGPTDGMAFAASIGWSPWADRRDGLCGKHRVESLDRPTGWPLRQASGPIL
jgi:hypothetical protein